MSNISEEFRSADSAIINATLIGAIVAIIASPFSDITPSLFSTFNRFNSYIAKQIELKESFDISGKGSSV